MFFVLAFFIVAGFGFAAGWIAKTNDTPREATNASVGTHRNADDRRPTTSDRAASTKGADSLGTDRQPKDGGPTQEQPKSTNNSEKQGERPKPVAFFQASDLWEKYGSNALRIETEYKGKPVQVSGGLISVRAVDGKYVVGLAVIEAGPFMANAQLSPLERKWLNEGFPPNVLCYLAPTAQTDFANAKKNDYVHLVGYCKGIRRDPAVYGGYVVVLENCVAGNLPPK